MRKKDIRWFKLRWNIRQNNNEMRVLEQKIRVERDYLIAKM